MPEPRTPQDHQKKAAPVEEHFTFTSGGVDYTMPNKTLDIVNARFVRLNRRRDEIDYALTAVEEVAGDDDEGERIIKAWDEQTRDEMKKSVRALGDHIGASLGE